MGDLSVLRVGAVFAATAALALVGLSGCSEKGGEAPSANQADYAVVSMGDDVGVDDLFDFESRSSYALSDPTHSGVGPKEGVYTIGSLDEGGSIVWYSSDDGYGYDDRLFVYVKDEVGPTSWMQWANKLDEPSISLDQFEESL